MLNEINCAFARPEHILPLIHVVSAIFLISAQLNCVFSMGPLIENKNTQKESKFAKAIILFQTYEKYFLLFSCISTFSGFLISITTDYKFQDPMIEGVTATKLAIFIFMSINFCYMKLKFISFKNFVKENDSIQAKENLIIIFKYFMPLNIIISLIAVYLGIVIRGF